MKRLLLVLTACAVGVAFSVLATRGETSTPKTDCATLAVPENADYALAYDPESGELKIDYVDSAGNDKSAVVDSRASACKANKGVKKAIDRALEAAAEVTAGECAAFKELLKDGKAAEKAGRKGDPAAARAYVEKHCK
jgi:hypothetical protein